MNSYPSSENNTLNVVLRFHEAFNRHDVEAIMRLMSDDCVFENTYPPPDGTRYQGQAAVRTFWQQLFSQSPDARFDLEEAFALGERCVLRWTYHWVDDQGQAGHVRGVDIFRVLDGRVTEKLSYVKG